MLRAVKGEIDCEMIKAICGKEFILVLMDGIQFETAQAT